MSCPIQGADPFQGRAPHFLGRPLARFVVSLTDDQIEGLVADARRRVGTNKPPPLRPASKGVRREHAPRFSQDRRAHNSSTCRGAQLLSVCRADFAESLVVDSQHIPCASRQRLAAASEFDAASPESARQAAVEQPIRVSGSEARRRTAFFRPAAAAFVKLPSSATKTRVRNRSRSNRGRRDIMSSPHDIHSHNSFAKYACALKILSGTQR